MTRLKILFVASEMAPLAKSGGLGDVVGALPPELARLDADVRIILPLYKQIKEQYGRQLQYLTWRMVKMGWRTLYCGDRKSVV